MFVGVFHEDCKHHTWLAIYTHFSALALLASSGCVYFTVTQTMGLGESDSIYIISQVLDLSQCTHCLLCRKFQCHEFCQVLQKEDYMMLLARKTWEIMMQPKLPKSQGIRILLIGGTRYLALSHSYLWIGYWWASSSQHHASTL